MGVSPLLGHGSRLVSMFLIGAAMAHPCRAEQRSASCVAPAVRPTRQSATGVSPVLGHGQDGHGTPLGADPKVSATFFGPLPGGQFPCSSDSELRTPNFGLRTADLFSRHSSLATALPTPDPGLALLSLSPAACILGNRKESAESGTRSAPGAKSRGMEEAWRKWRPTTLHPRLRR
jgi:hypothetical protein